MLFQELPRRSDLVRTDRRSFMRSQFQGLNNPPRVSSVFFGRHALPGFDGISRCRTLS